MELLPELLIRNSEARAAQDWTVLEKNSIRILQIAFRNGSLDSSSLKSIIQSYLASIIGSGEFLTDLASPEKSQFQAGLAKLLEFLQKRPHYFEDSAELVHAAQEICLLALEPSPPNRNKIGKLLRKLARPDLAIVICNQILDSTRLNYYAMTVLCGAYCDLENFDEAISVAEKALKYTPERDRTYPLTSLVRAHTLKFKKTGDVSEVEKALEYGHLTLDIKVDSVAANVFMAAAIASGISDEISYAKETLSKAEPQLRKVDIEALFQAYQASQALSPSASVVEVVEEYEDDYFTELDSLMDLIAEDHGFTPTVSDLRNMRGLFIRGGWFYQGNPNVPCSACGLFRMHSYRKHFRRYGKDMHYWGLVCEHCKYATDSIDYDKKTFSLISNDLENRFPISLACQECWQAETN